MHHFNSKANLWAILAPLCVLGLVVQASHLDKKLQQVCAGGSRSPTVATYEQAKALLDHYNSGAAHLCSPEYEDGFNALTALLSDSLLDNVCSSNTIDAIHDFHAAFIYDLSPEMSDDQIKARKRLSKQQRTKPLPPALKTFFILFAKQINAQCSEHLVQKLSSYNRDQSLVRDEDLAFVMNVTNVENSRPLKKARQVVRKWIFAHKFEDLVYVKPAKQIPVTIPNKPKVIKLYNLCTKRFMPIVEELFEPVVRLNNLGYSDHYVLSQQTREQLHGDKDITRWNLAFQYCEALKNVEFIAIDVSEKADSKGYKAKLGFMSDQQAAEARKIAHAIEDPTMEAISVESNPVVFDRDAKALEESKIRSEVKKHMHSMRSLISERTNPIIVMERQLVMSLLRRFGLQPMPLGVESNPLPLVIFFILCVCIVTAAILVPTLLAHG